MNSPVNVMGPAGYVLFWALFAIAFSVFAYRTYQLWKYISLGKKDEKLTDLAKRAFITFVHVIGQWCSFKNLTKKDRASVGHVFIAWGFFLFVLYYTLFIIFGAGFGLYNTLQHNRFFLYYSWIMNIAAVFVITGCLWGLVRRFVIKPDRLKNEQTTEDLIALLSILAIPILHLFKEATAIAAGHPPVGLGTSPAIAQALSNIFTTHAEGFYIGFFWAHWGIVLLILIQFGYSKHLHMLAAPANLLLRSNEPKGALKPIDIEKAESFGVAKITDFTRKHLLDGFACVSCGRCQDACPAYATDKPLNPKELIQNMKKELMEIAPKLLKGKGEAGPVLEKMVTEEILWACTTCRNCMEICPVANEHMTKIIDMRRNLVLDKGQMPETVMGALRSMETRGHPWRGTMFSKTDWASDLKLKQMAEVQETDILFWVGCTSALDERCQKIAKSTAKILTTAGINFAILGEEESCCGDMARRVGNEYLYQMQAMKNIETLKKYKFSKILTTCPHCFNTLKYEYPQFSGNFEVVHHSQYILGLINDGKLKLATPLDKTVTYHDPCYLGRYSNIYQEPRTLISSIPGAKLVEIGDRKKRNSFCCGGGGGRSWMEEPNPKISHMRMDDAIKTKADCLAIACPLCAIMFEDAVKAKGAENLKVQDIAEIVANAI